jgi:hypothetical protein
MNKAFDRKVYGKIVKIMKDFKAYLIKYNQTVHVKFILAGSRSKFL